MIETFDWDEKPEQKRLTVVLARNRHAGADARGAIDALVSDDTGEQSGDEWEDTTRDDAPRRFDRGHEVDP